MYIPRRFIWEGVVQQDWFRRQRQRIYNCRTECRIKGHVVGLFTRKYKKNMKNSKGVVNWVYFNTMTIISLKLRHLIEASGPVIKVSCSY
jgi:hypothetical protein